jgi:hypothetical protein
MSQHLVDDIIAAILPEGSLEETPSGFQQVGHVGESTSQCSIDKPLIKQHILIFESSISHTNSLSPQSS